MFSCCLVVAVPIVKHVPVYKTIIRRIPVVKKGKLTFLHKKKINKKKNSMNIQFKKYSIYLKINKVGEKMLTWN